MDSLSSPRRVLLVTLALGWSVDLLFYGKFLGVSLLVFVFLLIVAPLNVINPDDFIARQNLAHYQRTGALDPA